MSSPNNCLSNRLFLDKKIQYTQVFYITDAKQLLIFLELRFQRAFAKKVIITMFFPANSDETWKLSIFMTLE